MHSGFSKSSFLGTAELVIPYRRDKMSSINSIGKFAAKRGAAVVCVVMLCNVGVDEELDDAELDKDELDDEDDEGFEVGC